jgi:hypothetical protein
MGDTVERSLGPAKWAIRLVSHEIAKQARDFGPADRAALAALRAVCFKPSRHRYPMPFTRL